MADDTPHKLTTLLGCPVVEIRTFPEGAFVLMEPTGRQGVAYVGGRMFRISWEFNKKPWPAPSWDWTIVPING